MEQNEMITCKDCGKEFEFTVNEYNFYKDNNLVDRATGVVNKPQRCKACRDARKNQRNGKRNN